MRQGRHKEIDAGEAISIESALTVMVVLILIRLLFFIPLVNIDRAHLEKAQHDAYWKGLAEYLSTQNPDTLAAAPFIHAFKLDGSRVFISNDGDVQYIEALSPDGAITIIRRRGEHYILLVTNGQNATVTYKYGKIHWSPSEKEWFTSGNTIDYGEKSFTRAMQEAYRAWTKETRGF